MVDDELIINRCRILRQVGIDQIDRIRGVDIKHRQHQSVHIAVVRPVGLVGSISGVLLRSDIYRVALDTLIHHRQLYFIRLKVMLVHLNGRCTIRLVMILVQRLIVIVGYLILRSHVVNMYFLRIGFHLIGGTVSIGKLHDVIAVTTQSIISLPLVSTLNLSPRNVASNAVHRQAGSRSGTLILGLLKAEVKVGLVNGEEHLCLVLSVIDTVMLSYLVISKFPLIIQTGNDGIRHDYVVILLVGHIGSVVNHLDTRNAAHVGVENICGRKHILILLILSSGNLSRIKSSLVGVVLSICRQIRKSEVIHTGSNILRGDGHSHIAVVETESNSLQNLIHNRLAVLDLDVSGRCAVDDKLILSIIIGGITVQIGICNIHRINRILRKGHLNGVHVSVVGPVGRILCELLKIGATHIPTGDILSRHGKINVLNLEMTLDKGEGSGTLLSEDILLYGRGDIIGTQNHRLHAVDDNRLLICGHFVTRSIGKVQRQGIGVVTGQQLLCLPHTALRIPAPGERNRRTTHHEDGVLQAQIKVRLFDLEINGYIIIGIDNVAQILRPCKIVLHRHFRRNGIHHQRVRTLRQFAGPAGHIGGRQLYAISVLSRNRKGILDDAVFILAKVGASYHHVTGTDVVGDIVHTGGHVGGGKGHDDLLRLIDTKSNSLEHLFGNGNVVTNLHVHRGGGVNEHILKGNPIRNLVILLQEHLFRMAAIPLHGDHIAPNGAGQIIGIADLIPLRGGNGHHAGIPTRLVLGGTGHGGLGGGDVVRDRQNKGLFQFHVAVVRLTLHLDRDRPGLVGGIHKGDLSVGVNRGTDGIRPFDGVHIIGTTQNGIHVDLILLNAIDQIYIRNRKFRGILLNRQRIKRRNSLVAVVAGLGGLDTDDTGRLNGHGAGNRVNIRNLLGLGVRQLVGDCTGALAALCHVRIHVIGIVEGDAGRRFVRKAKILLRRIVDVNLFGNNRRLVIAGKSGLGDPHGKEAASLFGGNRAVVLVNLNVFTTLNDGIGELSFAATTAHRQDPLIAVLEGDALRGNTNQLILVRLFNGQGVGDHSLFVLMIRRLARLNGHNAVPTERHLTGVLVDASYDMVRSDPIGNSTVTATAEGGVSKRFFRKTDRNIGGGIFKPEPFLRKFDCIDGIRSDSLIIGVVRRLGGRHRHGADLTKGQLTGHGVNGGDVATGGDRIGHRTGTEATGGHIGIGVPYPLILRLGIRKDKAGLRHLGQHDLIAGHHGQGNDLIIDPIAVPVKYVLRLDVGAILLIAGNQRGVDDHPHTDIMRGRLILGILVGPETQLIRILRPSGAAGAGNAALVGSIT